MDYTMERFYREKSEMNYMCSGCGNNIIEIGDLYENYFKGKKVECPKCKKKVSFFKELKKSVTGPFLMSSLPLMTLGVKTTTFIIKVKSNEMREIDLEEQGIPETAEILSVNYTMNVSSDEDTVSLVPLEFHGNSSPYIRKYHDNKILIYVANLGEINKIITQKMSVLITWRDEVSLPKKNLITAFLYFLEGEWGNTIVPANVSLESKLEFFLDKKLKEISKGNIAKKKLNKFIEDDMTYSHQLNILLPLIVSISGSDYKPLPEEIKGELTKLKKFRDVLVHDGKFVDEITENEINSVLTAVFLVHIYIDLLVEENKPKEITSPVTPVFR